MLRKMSLVCCWWKFYSFWRNIQWRRDSGPLCYAVYVSYYYDFILRTQGSETLTNNLRAQ
jgi:hypothetical protein